MSLTLAAHLVAMALPSKGYIIIMNVYLALYITSMILTYNVIYQRGTYGPGRPGRLLDAALF